MIVTILLLQKSNVVLSANCEIPEVGISGAVFNWKHDNLLYKANTAYPLFFYVE